ncbi:MAG: hypothetical protein NTU49_10250, partial [Gammaproteobacteria bacterium]|nr:hypothetical protein [Gammaproteobacteria bacterium]
MKSAEQKKIILIAMSIAIMLTSGLAFSASEQQSFPPAEAVSTQSASPSTALPVPGSTSSPTASISTFPADPALTGSNGDAGDPNNNPVVRAATSPASESAQEPVLLTTPATPATVATPAAPVVLAKPLPMQQTTTPSFGSTSNGRAAFTQVVRNLMPLDPGQILMLRDMFDQSQRAVAQYPGTPPKPTSSSVLVNMSPGASPPVIRLRSGYVTSLVFLDSTGQPWPVVGYDLGNPKAFNIQPNAPDGKSDTLI